MNTNKAEIEQRSKINFYDEKLFPKIADLLKDLNESEKSAVEEIILKEPGDTRQSAASKVVISERQLRNVCHSVKVQEAVYRISKELFRTELPSVLKTLSKKAKEGEAWAVKLFLEVSGEFGENPVPLTNIQLITSVQRSNLDEVNKSAEDAWRNMSPEELHHHHVQRLMLSSKGGRDTSGS